MAANTMQRDRFKA